MKRSKFRSVLAYAFVAIFLTSTTTSCLEDSEREVGTVLVGAVLFGLLLGCEKTVEVTDLEGKNKVTLNISAENQVVMEQYAENSFELVPIYEADLRKFEETQSDTEAVDVALEVATEAKVVVLVESQKLDRGVVGFHLKQSNKRALAPVNVVFGNSSARKLLARNTATATKCYELYQSPIGVNTWTRTNNYSVGYLKTNTHSNCNRGHAIKVYQTGIDVVCVVNC